MLVNERLNKPLLRILLYGVFCTAFGYLNYLGSVRATPWLHAHSLNLPIFGKLGLLLCVITILLMLARFADKRPLSDFGLTPKNVVPETLIGFFIGASMIVVNLGMRYVFGWDRNINPAPHYNLAEVLLFALLVGLSEEIVFRGYLFKNMEQRFDSKVALIGSSILFGLAHFINPDKVSLIGQIVFVVNAMSVGVLLGALYLITRRLWLAIGFHWGFDTLGLIFVSETSSGINILISLAVGIALFRHVQQRRNGVQGESTNPKTTPT